MVVYIVFKLYYIGARMYDQVLGGSLNCLEQNPLCYYYALSQIVLITENKTF